MFCTGGGIGDCVQDFVHCRAAWRLKYLVETYGARIRAITLCHNDGVADLFTYNPYIHEHICEPWRLPNPEDAQKYNSPLDGYWPIKDDCRFLSEFGGEVPLNPTEFYLNTQEERLLSRLLSKRPCIVIQPFAGLSDRDAFDQPTLFRLFEHVTDLQPQSNIIVVGKNHERTHKYTREECPPHPNVTDLIDKTSIRFNYQLVKHCDAFCGSHSSLILVAWDWRRRNALVMPAPMMVENWKTLDPKYKFGATFPESRTFLFPFGDGVPRNFNALDTAYIAAYLLGRAN